MPVFDITDGNSKTTLLKNYAAYLLSSKNRKAYDAQVDELVKNLEACLSDGLSNFELYMVMK